MFMGLTVIISLFFWFRYRQRGEMQQTIRAAIEKGQELSPEIIDRLGHTKRPKDKDLRLAVIWLAICVAIFLFGAAVSTAETEENIFTIFSGISAFPLMIGLAYLIMWRFTDHEQ